MKTFKNEEIRNNYILIRAKWMIETQKLTELVYNKIAIIKLKINLMSVDDWKKNRVYDKKKIDNF